MICVRSACSRFGRALALLAVAGCGGGGKPGDVGNIGGSVTGLTADGLVLQLDSASEHDEVQVKAGDSEFQFTRYVLEGVHYNVTVATQPDGETCTVVSGEGDMGSGPVRTVTVFCGATVHSLGGTISGLAPTESVVLELNGKTKTVSTEGDYQFDDLLPVGAAYAVAVKTAPTGKWCAVTNPTGIMGDADVTEIDVACSVVPPTKPVVTILNTNPKLMNVVDMTCATSTSTRCMVRNSWNPPAGSVMVISLSMDGQAEKLNTCVTTPGDETPDWIVPRHSYQFIARLSDRCELSVGPIAALSSVSVR